MTPDQVITVPISASERELCETYASEEAIGGHSHVRSDRTERLASLNVDQLLANVSTLAGCKWLFGKALGHYVYRATKFGFTQHAQPGVGDGGHDILGCNVDFKSCEWALVGPRALHDVFLPVRPAERHEGWIYILVLVELDRGLAHLVGWVRDEELPDRPNGKGVFEGACCLYTPDLHPLPPFGWAL